MIQCEAILVLKTMVNLTTLLQYNATCQASKVSQPLSEEWTVYRIQDNLYFIRVSLKLMCLYTPSLLVIYCKISRIGIKIYLMFV